MPAMLMPDHNAMPPDAGRRRVLAGGLAATAVCALGLPTQAQTGPRLLAFGDSLTAGYGLPSGKGLVPGLRDYLARAGKPGTVINAGLSGDTTYGGRIRIGLSLRRHGPDAVMVELGGNDMLRRWTADRAEQNLDIILSRAGAGGRPVLLVGLHAPGGDADWRRSWAEMWPHVAKRHGAALLPDLYAPLAAIPRTGRAGYLQRDGVHPSARGVQLLVGHLGPSVVDLLRAVPGG